MSDPMIFRVVDAQDPKSSVIVYFEYSTEKNEQETDKAGVPLFDTLLIAYVSAPGLNKSVTPILCERKLPDGTVKTYPTALQRYGKEIEAFKRGEQSPEMAGTPLTELTGVDAAMRASLKAINVHTVESLAELSDSVQMMGFHKYKRMAQAYVEQRNGQAPMNKLAAELEVERERTARLEKTISDLASEVARLKGDGDEAPRAHKRAKAA